MKLSQQLLAESLEDASPSYVSPQQLRDDLLAVLEEFERRRQEMPWYRRWFYCIKDMIGDLTALKQLI